MLSYEEAKDLFSRAKNKEKGKPIANNTYLMKSDNDEFIIRFHETDIIKISKDNIFTLDNGGYQTLTTKERFNEFSPLRIYQHLNVWYIWNGTWNPKENETFFNGIQCNGEGEILNPQKKEIKEEDKQKRKKLNKLIKNYINEFIKDIEKNGLGIPEKGDCFGCSFVDASKGIQRGKIKENESMGFDHYISHFEEGYFVRSLLWKAINERGYSNPSFIWQLGNIRIFKETLQWFFNRRKAELLKHIS